MPPACLEGPLSAPVQDGGGVQKNACWCQKVLDPIRPACRHLGSAEALPRAIRPRQYDPHLLHSRISIDDHKELQALDFIAAVVYCGLSTLDPLLLAFGSSAISRGTSCRNASRSEPPQHRRLPMIPLSARRVPGLAGARTTANTGDGKHMRAAKRMPNTHRLMLGASSVSHGTTDVRRPSFSFLYRCSGLQQLYFSSNVAAGSMLADSSGAVRRSPRWPPTDRLGGPSARIAERQEITQRAVWVSIAR